MPYWSITDIKIGKIIFDPNREHAPIRSKKKMMELRRRNLHNADIGKKIENNGRKVMSDL